MNLDKLLSKLETERLIMKKLTLTDVNIIYKNSLNNETIKNIINDNPISRIEDIEDLINWFVMNNDNSYRWSIYRKEDDKLIGVCGFNRWDKKNNICEIMYNLDRFYCSQGYLLEALNKIIIVGFENISFNRIQAYVYIDNNKSINLLKYLGFKDEGIMREGFYFIGKYYDYRSFSLLKSEWKSIDDIPIQLHH